MSSSAPFAVNVIPPSPEAAALARYADVPVNLYTGTPQIMIPLYDLRERDLHLPVYLSYHASGHKVEDEATRVGLGWALNAGGLVTRSIRGLPDEYRPGGFLDQASVAGSVATYQSGTAEERFQAYDAMARGCLNAEPDTYYFNFAGFTGRFQFDWDGSIVVDSAAKLRITPIGPDPGAGTFFRGWEIITPDGVRWVFEASETTSSQFDAAGILQNPCLAVLNTRRPPHTWHLTTVSSPSTDSSINFSYADYTQTTQRWAVETLVHNEFLAPAVAQRERLISTTSGKYLSRIETQSGDTTIEFLPGDERMDVTGSPGLRTLGEVRVTDRSDRIVRQWAFAYHYDVGRLGLRSVQELGGSERQEPYQFEYYGGQLPGRLSVQQDHWGFYNNNPAQTLIPATVAQRQGGMVSLLGADRSPAPTKLTIGMLRKITYPAGGSDTFEFEPHDYSFEQARVLEVPITQRQTRWGRAPQFDTPPGQVYSESTPFTLATNELEVVLIMSFTHGMIFGAGGFLPSVSIQKSTGEEVFRLAPGGAPGPNGDPVTTQHMIVFNPRPSSPDAAASDLPPGKLDAGDYALVTQCRKPPSANIGQNSAGAQLRWDAPTGQTQTLIRQGGGVRISSVTKSYGLGSPDNVTSYEYRTVRTGARISSGSLLESDYVYSHWMQCVVGTGGFGNDFRPQFFRYSQNRSALGTTQGSHVGYSLVTVVHGANGENGRTEHRFTSPIDFPDSRPTTVPFPPATSFDFRRGLVTQLNDYPAGAATPVRSILNTYAFTVRSIGALKVGWEVPAVGMPEGAGGGISGAGHLYRYAVAQYANNLGYSRLTSQQTSLHDSTGSSVTQTANEYQEGGHKQLTKERRTTNDVELVREFRYASDYPVGADPALDALVGDHVVNALVETVTYWADGLVISAQRNRYAMFDGRVKLAQVETARIDEPSVATSTVFDAVADLYEPRHVFRTYDYHGNLVEQSPAGGMVTCYIWDAAGSHLIAQVENATLGQVFHDSFEDTEDGTATDHAHTGSRSKVMAGAYSLSPADLPQVAGDYILSYWQRTASAEAWVKVETRIPGYIPGTPISTDPIDGYLDEVRLHPIAAHMTTFTHQPLRGLQTQSDPNGISANYEYDGFGRLSLLRDHDRQIRTHYAYRLPEHDEENLTRPGYLRTRTALVGGLETVEDFLNADHNAVARSTDYLDGFARAIQRVRWRGAPDGRDSVEIIEYDPFGRQAIRYLPCAVNDNSGEFKTPIRNILLSFYASDDETVAKTSVPFAQTRFDGSPLDRVVEQGAPGEAWQPQADPTDSHTQRYEYRTNSANDDVLRWRLEADGASTTDSYAPGELRVETMLDEHNTRHNVFYDRLDREVLRETEAENGEALRTYFVHDKKGNLACAIPPRVSAPLDTVSLAAECHHYRYDYRNRLVERAAPGAETTFLVYDRWDRLVLSQTGNQRCHGRWTYQKFDALDRLVLSGEIEIPGGRRDVAKLLDEFYSSDTTDQPRFELLADNQHYSDRTFPALGEAGTIDRVVYYDDYQFVGALPDPARFAFGEEWGGNGQHLPRACGRMTGEQLRVLGSAQYISTVVYYDQEYRAIQAISDDHLGGTTRHCQTFKLSGQPLNSLIVHHSGPDGEKTRVQQDHTYDHGQRLVCVHHQVNDQQRITLLSQEFNDLGEVVRKGLHSSGDDDMFAQLLDYRYNIRGWLTSINRQPVPDDDTRLFSLEQGYESENTALGSVPQFNGNVSFATWTHAHQGQEQSYLYRYDAFDRLVSAQYRSAGMDGAFDVRGVESPAIPYDANGNILGLSRHGLIDEKPVEIDHLTYTYRTNQLTHVDDASGHNEGFRDNGVQGNAYEYDHNGNLITDRNKALDITYNYQNLVERVKTSTGESVRFGSDASGGRCFRELIGSDGTTDLRIDYASRCVSEDGILRLLRHDEGWLVRSAREAEWVYEYHLLDPQGNVRVAFRSDTATPYSKRDHQLTVVLAADYYPFGLAFVGGRLFDIDDSNVKHRFSNKELQEILDLGWYDFGGRILDPSVGRWTGIDARANQYPHISPYAFVLNNPVRYFDLDGRDASDSTKGGGFSPARLNAIDPEILRWDKIESFELPPDEAFPLDRSITQNLIGSRVAYSIVYALKQRWTSLRDLVRDLNPPTPQLTVGSGGLVIEIVPPRRDHTDALLTLVEIALLWTPSKVKGPVFSEQKLLFHYTYQAESSFGKGLYTSSSVTAEGGLTASQAVDRLGLSRSLPPDKVIPIIDRGNFIPLQGGVVPPHKYGLGGGSQFTNPVRVPAEQILPARPIKP
ncbi:DUF6443 domain-containing protein [Nonomuraea endophytica]|uniref:DUF6443 domain-containing protein n=1 Tax=Nonomuraea endophytica TaxID=714136 RepID=UPI0037C60946